MSLNGKRFFFILRFSFFRGCLYLLFNHESLSLSQPQVFLAAKLNNGGRTHRHTQTQTQTHTFTQTLTHKHTHREIEREI